jgi:molybdate transport system substrate-binding protein
MSDNSMSLAVAEIARNYSARRNVVVNTSFSVPSMQEAQIAEGVAADILITPQAQWVDTLKTQGLIDIYSPMVIAQNKLVLVGPSESQLRYNPESNTLPTAAIIKDIDSDMGFVVASPETLIEGGYSKEALRSLDSGDYLAPYTLYIKHLGSMFDMVSRHGAYGIFLYSSTVNRSGFKVLGRLPEDAYRPIQYTAVVIAGENMDEARRFMDYLKSPEAKATLKNNGFTIE